MKLIKINVSNNAAAKIAFVKNSIVANPG